MVGLKRMIHLSHSMISAVSTLAVPRPERLLDAEYQEADGGCKLAMCHLVVAYAASVEKLLLGLSGHV